MRKPVRHEPVLGDLPGEGSFPSTRAMPRSGLGIPTYRVIGWAYVVVCLGMILVAGFRHEVSVVEVQAPTLQTIPAAPATADAAAWFRRVKPYCNPVEVETAIRNDPHPKTVRGAGYHAACLALAGRIDDARKVIDRLQPQNRDNAAAIVFDVGHPVADAGDDRSAGPMMELVVDYMPAHYMALYHAGMAEYMLGQYPLARANLRKFLEIYRADDGWRTNATDVIARIDRGNAEDRRRPREPGR
jgi:hypothetical protein